MKRLLEGQFERQVAATFFGQSIGVIISIASSAIIARWLGPEGKGILAITLLLPGALVIFLNLGIGVANVYYIGTRRFDVSTLSKNSVTFALLTSALGTVLIVGFLALGWIQPFLPGVPAWLILIAAVLFPIGILAGYFNTILQGLQSIITLNIIHLSQRVLTLIFLCLFIIILNLGILGALVSHLGTGLVGLIALTAVVGRKGGIFKPSWNSRIMGSTLSFGLKGQIGNILQFFNYRLDLFILNYFLGPDHVGIYTVSVGLAELLWHFPDAVSFVLLSKVANTKPGLLDSFTPRVLRSTLGVTAVGGIGLLILGKSIISITYSPVFLAAYIPLVALIPGVVLLGGAKVLTSNIAGRGSPQYNSITSGLALIITVILDIVLIPRYGVLGAALASSIAYTVSFFASVGFYRVVSGRKKETEKIGCTCARY